MLETNRLASLRMRVEMLSNEDGIDDDDDEEEEEEEKDQQICDAFNSIAILLIFFLCSFPFSLLPFFRKR